MVNQAENRQHKPSGHSDTPAAGQVVRVGLSTPELCLGFANSLNNRLTAHPTERLNSYEALAVWGGQQGILTEREVGRLAQEAARRPTEAASILERAIKLREALYRIFSAVASSRSPQPADLAILNAAVAEALASLHIMAAGDGFAWVWARGEEVLDRVLWPVALAAADLLTSSARRAVRKCAATNCGWLFLDTTRNRSRRWCDMKVCGNRAKARRHYERKKNASTAPADHSSPC
jgi:predicted RNA-binding Zn ribbon-like protein